ncbi:hypothetical protein [Companilactobacillus mishanensis]|uniref:Uncharacterized protein n=1 Tax=Companilactobacillus mishanensis TaxID=2486008 RepID=A0A5P0ZK21_9LACO|nr:hypothetical protein [Companilactobacillus mishanensis]MQS45257.1 hypothetical protein [Companilactobacillus mishanensis]MQS53433.1 hypothetical protein [Companilactobacillus mishanensis]MQS89651.1 hypothetical protein [Companilactobacillus mishanensis]
MPRWMNIFVDTTSVFLMVALIFLNIRYGVNSGAALISDSVTLYILITFFSSRLDHFGHHHA